jgi:hypothetical protein
MKTAQADSAPCVAWSANKEEASHWLIVIAVPHIRPVDGEKAGQLKSDAADGRRRF